MSVFTQRCVLGGDRWSVAVKDSIDVKGMATTMGSAALAGARVAEEHADVVAAILNADCQLIGKVALHELAYGMTGVNHYTGPVINHRYPDLIPGGSSSGSAVAVASALADFALGTDTGGSIRVPAACCGVYGFKPTFGRVSRKGVWPAGSTLDCVGPLAASADMLVNAMKVIDPTFTQIAGLGDIVLGVVQVKADEEVQDTVDTFLARTGFGLVPVQLSLLEAAFNAGMTLINAEAWQAWGHLLADGSLGQDVARRLEQAAQTSAEAVRDAESVRTQFTLQVDEALAHTPVLVLPTLPGYPMPLEKAQAGQVDLGISKFVRPFNLSGHPAISIPLESSRRLPVGLQLVAKKGDDELLCELARVLSAFITQS